MKKTRTAFSARRVFVAAHTAHSTDAVHWLLPRRRVIGSITRVRQQRARKLVHRMPGSGAVHGGCALMPTAHGAGSGCMSGSARPGPTEFGHNRSAVKVAAKDGSPKLRNFSARFGGGNTVGERRPRCRKVGMTLPLAASHEQASSSHNVGFLYRPRRRYLASRFKSLIGSKLSKPE